MRRVSSNWTSVLLAVFALIVGMATLPGCDSSSSEEGAAEDINTPS